MSFDLMVFDPSAAPTSDCEEFLVWYDEQTEWSEDHGYDDPEVCSKSLRSWLVDIVPEFPMMDGPLPQEFDEDDPRLTDYSIGKDIIYAGFSWSSAEAAHERTFLLAKKHNLGFFDLTAGTGGVWLPTKGGGYEMVHSADDLDQDEEGYGLFVFDPDQAPHDEESFVDWLFRLHVQLELGNDAEITPRLQSWFAEVTNLFPFMYEPGDLDMKARVTDYCFVGPAIFGLFPEACADEARETVRRLAKTHALGVHEISSDGDVWMPTADGGYEVAFRLTGADG